MKSSDRHYFADVTRTSAMTNRGRPPPSIITSNWTPEYVIPSSPSKYSSTSDDASDDSFCVTESKLGVPEGYCRQRSNSTPNAPDIIEQLGQSNISKYVARPESQQRRRRLPPTPDQIESQHRNAQLPPHPSWAQRFSPEMTRPPYQNLSQPHIDRDYLNRTRSGGHRKLPKPPHHQAPRTFGSPRAALPPPSLADKGRQRSENIIRSHLLISEEPPRPASAACNGQDLSSTITNQLSPHSPSPMLTNYQTQAHQHHKDLSPERNIPSAYRNVVPPDRSFMSPERKVISPERNVISPEINSLMSDVRRSATPEQQDVIDGDSCSTPPRGSSAESPSMSLDRLTTKSSSDNDLEQVTAVGSSVEVNDPSDKDTRGSSISPLSVTDEASRSASVNSSHSITASTSWTSTGVEKADTRLGLVHMAVQYFPVRKRLRVSILKVEGLAGQLRPELELHAFAKLCLMPGKIQRQQSRIVKRTRDAVFNEEFFFDQVVPEDIVHKTVSVRVCHHVGKQFHKDIVIGEVDMHLNGVHGISTKKEIRLAYPLKPKLNMKKLGRIQISSCLEMDARRLTVNVIKADDLPKYGISGPPDPCVKITVNQNGREQTKQTRILKNTTSAVYKEAVMFLVSTRPQDLEAMEIIIGVHDTARTAAMDDLIGNAYLGALAQDKSELDQWKQTLHNCGKEYKATHSLKMPKD